MKEIQAYQSADGSVHLSEKAAIDRDENMLGEEVDGLLRVYTLELSRASEYKACLNAMKNKTALLASCKAIIQILEHAGEE